METIQIYLQTYLITLYYIYIMYINIQDIENMAITFNTIKRYIYSIINSDRVIVYDAIMF